jgi:hypothetical protein
MNNEQLEQETASTSEPTTAHPWFVAHTRPRCEKKLAEYCEREGFSVTLPLYKSVKKYRGKTVTFQKPLFPGYVFLRLGPDQPRKVYQSDYVANLLTVVDQKLFEQQLGDILEALETDYEVFSRVANHRRLAREDQIRALARLGRLCATARGHNLGAVASGFHQPGRRGED